jgi:outer membrane protein assembly factor BamE (lipoprotein component of BamABCDE complex)
MSLCHIMPGSLLGTALLLGCVPPILPPNPQRLEQGLLAFLVDGQTAREQVLLRLGAPMAEFEGKRIWTYDFVWDPAGDWRRVGRTVVSEWRYIHLPGTCSLVLVFGPEGRLLRHSLVTSHPAPPPATPPAPGAATRESSDRVL